MNLQLYFFWKDMIVSHLNYWHKIIFLLIFSGNVSHKRRKIEQKLHHMEDFGSWIFSWGQYFDDEFCEKCFYSQSTKSVEQKILF